MQLNVLMINKHFEEYVPWLRAKTNVQISNAHVSLVNSEWNGKGRGGVLEVTTLIRLSFTAILQHHSLLELNKLQLKVHKQKHINHCLLTCPLTPPRT